MKSVSKFLKKTLKPFFYRLPRWYWIRVICDRYVKYYEGNNGYDMEYNGEFSFLSYALSTMLRGVHSPIIFDVGANIGSWTIKVLEQNPNALIYCFEPSTRAYNVLISRNFAKNVRCNKLGLGSKKAEVKLFLRKAHENSSIFREAFSDKIYDTLDEEIVQIQRISDYCKDYAIPNIDFLKIDTEGNDCDVLLGAKELLASKKIKIIQFEYNEYYIFARKYLLDVFSLLSQFDYKIFKLLPHGLLYLPNYDSRFENFKGSNFVALANESQSLSTIHF